MKRNERDALLSSLSTTRQVSLGHPRGAPEMVVGEPEHELRRSSSGVVYIGVLSLDLDHLKLSFAPVEHRPSEPDRVPRVMVRPVHSGGPALAEQGPWRPHENEARRAAPDVHRTKRPPDASLAKVPLRPLERDEPVDLHELIRQRYQTRTFTALSTRSSSLGVSYG